MSSLRTLLISALMAGLLPLCLPDLAQGGSAWGQDLDPLNQVVTGDELLESARVEHKAGNLRKARRLYEQAAEVFRASGNLPEEARTLQVLGELLLNTDELMAARRHLERSCALRLELKQEPARVSCLELLAQVYVRTDDSSHALKAYEELRHLYNRLNLDEPAASTWLGTGKAFQSAGRPKEALSAYEKGVKAWTSLDRPEEAAPLHQARGRLLRQEGHYAEARKADLLAEKQLTQDVELGLSLIEDALAVGDRADALARGARLNRLPRTPATAEAPPAGPALSVLQAVRLELSILVAMAPESSPSELEAQGERLVTAWRSVPFATLELPRLEPVRYYLNKHSGLPRSQRDALLGAVLVVSAPKNALSETTLRSQLEVLLREKQVVAGAR